MYYEKFKEVWEWENEILHAYQTQYSILPTNKFNLNFFIILPVQFLIHLTFFDFILDIIVLTGIDSSSTRVEVIR